MTMVHILAKQAHIHLNICSQFYILSVSVIPNFHFWLHDLFNFTFLDLRISLEVLFIVCIDPSICRIQKSTPSFQFFFALQILAGELGIFSINFQLLSLPRSVKCTSSVSSDFEKPLNSWSSDFALRFLSKKCVFNGSIFSRIFCWCKTKFKRRNWTVKCNHFLISCPLLKSY